MLPLAEVTENLHDFLLLALALLEQLLALVMMLAHLVPDHLYGLLYQLARLFVLCFDWGLDLLLLRFSREG